MERGMPGKTVGVSTLHMESAAALRKSERVLSLARFSWGSASAGPAVAVWPSTSVLTSPSSHPLPDGQ